MFYSILESVPESLDVYEDGTGKDYRTSVAIAICDETQRVISVDCSLSYVFGHQPPPECPFFHEFSFAITIADLNDVELPFVTQDRNVVRGYLQDDAVRNIMPVVRASCSQMIERVKPPIIYRVTKMRNPVPKALQKHELITSLINDKGYAVQECGTDAYGRVFWLHVRSQH